MEKGKGTPKCFCLWRGHYAVQTHSVVFLPCNTNWPYFIHSEKGS